MSNKHGSKWIRPVKRWAIYARDRMMCVYCGPDTFPLRSQLTLDHIIPRSEGGDNDTSNLVTCCLSCNSSRQDRPLSGKLLRRARRAASRPVILAHGKKLLMEVAV